MRKTAQAADKLEHWLETPFGRYVTELEIIFFRQKLASINTGVAMQLGLPQWPLLQLWSGARVRAGVDGGQCGDVHVLAEALPWPENSLDLVVLPHGLDVCTQPSWVLAELYRVLTPQGRLLLSGLNPAGYWRLAAPKLCRTLNLHRVGAARQALLQAGFTVVQGSFMAYAWPWWHGSQAARPSAIEYMGNRWWPHWAAVYGLLAVKELAGVHPDAALMKRFRENKDLQLVAAGCCPGRD